MKALYRMSKTAGVGLGDYAEINVLSVIGCLVGMSSFLLLIFDDSYLMLLLPLGALITCVVALMQIRNSNGTQTGSLWAGIGMVLALVFGGINVGSRARAASVQSADRAQIAALVAKLSSAASTQSTVNSAYDLFHKRFKEQVNPETFTRTLSYRTGLYAKVPLKGMSLGENVIFEKNEETGVKTASALLILTLDRLDEKGKQVTADYPAAFRRDAGADWTIYSIPDWFGKEEKPPQ